LINIYATQVNKPVGGDGCVEGQSDFKNMFGYTRYDHTDANPSTYDGACSFFGGVPPLPEAIGWVITLALGCAFAALVGGLVYLSNRGVAENQQTGNNSEVYSTAGRTISAGLTAADVVSKWTWAATLLQSSNVAWIYGVSGPFWYASGATIQVLLFAILAIEIKRKCPAIHTMLEIVLVRWGTQAHLVFLFFGLLTCLIVTAMLILGGAATISALTGMSTYAANFAIPVPVMVYTAFGGLKGTYYASFTHTAVIFLALLIFLWKIYAGPSDLGSTDKMHGNLICAAQRQAAGSANGTWNYEGQYITMRSTGGLMFGIINTVGNFGTVFVDQSYWQGAIACKPSATYRGYLLGGMAWFAIPFSMATALGLAGRALDLPISATEAGNGLVPPAVAVHLMGQGGAFLVAFQLFLAITSTANSEQLAVASLFSYDVYKRYMNPNANGTQMIFVSRVMVCVWGVLSGIIATILFEMGIGLGWVYGAMGNFIGSAVVPMTMALLWKDCSALGAISGCIGGLVAAIIAWTTVAAQEGYTNAAGECVGVVNVDTLGQIGPLLAGNLCALCVSAFLAFSISMASPQNFDWEVLRRETDSFLVEADKNAHLADSGEESAEAMNIAYKYTLYGAAIMSFVLLILWPALSLPAGTFSKSYFGFWVALAFIWGHVAFAITVLLPIYELLTAKPEEEEAPKMMMMTPGAQQQQPMGFYMPQQPSQQPPQQPMGYPGQQPGYGQQPMLGYPGQMGGMGGYPGQMGGMGGMPGQMGGMGGMPGQMGGMGGMPMYR